MAFNGKLCLMVVGLARQCFRQTSSDGAERAIFGDFADVTWRCNSEECWVMFGVIPCCLPDL